MRVIGSVKQGGGGHEKRPLRAVLPDELARQSSPRPALLSFDAVLLQYNLHESRKDLRDILTNLFATGEWGAHYQARACTALATTLGSGVPERIVASSMMVYVIFLFRLVLGGTWILAGLSKLRQRESVSDTLSNFGIPDRLGLAIGRALPWLECGLGCLLLAGYRTTYAAATSTVLLAIFIVAISVNLWLGRSFECNCFGQTGGQISWLLVARNLVLLGLALVIAVRPSSYMSFDAPTGRTVGSMSTPPAVDAVPVLMITAAVFAGWFLCTSMWRSALVIARAEGGPALGLPERQYLRRWLRLDSSVPTEATED